MLTLRNLPMRCSQLIGTMLNRASDLAPEPLPMLRRMVPFLVSGVDGHNELLPQLVGTAISASQRARRASRVAPDVREDS